MHSNQADSESKARPASFAVLFFKTSVAIKFPGGKMFKKISNAEWAKIAARAMKGRSVLLPDICAGNLHLRKVPNFGNEQTVGG